MLDWGPRGYNVFDTIVKAQARAVLGRVLVQRERVKILALMCTHTVCAGQA